MKEGDLLLLFVAGVLFWMWSKGTGIFGRSDEVSASGVPPRPSGPGAVGAFGAAACVGAGAAFGAPQVGVAFAPLCSELAPHVVKGAVFLGEKTWEGAKFVADKAEDVATFAAKGAAKGGAALVAGGKEAAAMALDPLRAADNSLNIVGKSLNVADRVTEWGYGALPTPAKIAVAPLYASAQIATKAGSVAVGAAETVVGGARAAVDRAGDVIDKVFNLGGSSKVGRAKNGKDVFPNDMAQCRARGINTVDECGALFNLQTRKWPWQT